MATNRISDMTVEELSALIERVVDRRLENLLKPKGIRSMDEVNEAIRQHRITLPPGAKSSLELLREDRDA